MNKFKISENECSLNGLTVGESFDETTMEGEWLDEKKSGWVGQGYILGIENGVVVIIGIYNSNDYSDVVKNSFSGKIYFENREIDLQSLRPQMVSDLFAEPVESWDDEVEINMQYEYGNCNVEFSWSKERQLALNYIDVNFKQRESESKA